MTKERKDISVAQAKTERAEMLFARSTNKELKIMLMMLLKELSLSETAIEEGYEARK